MMWTSNIQRSSAPLLACNKICHLLFIFWYVDLDVWRATLVSLPWLHAPVSFWVIVLSLSLSHNIKVICPFLLDQFYWAERMFWLGVAPEPLKRCNLLPESTDDMCIMEAADVFTGSIHTALSATVQARALEISSQIAHQVNDFHAWLS